MNTTIWITFPSVDIVNPEEDEILERLARMLSERGLRGEYLVSGVKVQFMSENRPGTIDTLNRTGMTIGYQGNAHSLHPGLMEYEEGRDWEEGVQEAVRRETGWIQLDGSTDPARRGGILLLQEVFGERFAGFRGAGGWTPQVMEVLRRNEIRVHHTLFDLAETTGTTLAAYLGCLQISCGRSKWTGDFPYDSPLTNRLELEQIVRYPQKGLDTFIESYQRMVDNYPFRGPRILFVNFHPFFLLTDTIGDVLNYSNGLTPEPPDNLVRSNPLANAEMERRWDVVVRVFDWLASLPDVQFVTAVDFVEQARSLLTTTLSGGEIEQLARDVASLPLMRPPAYVRSGGRALSLSECFDLLRRALLHHHRQGELPGQLSTRLLLGPVDLPPAQAQRIAAPSVCEVIEAALPLHDSRVPASIILPGGPVEPYPFLVGMARALLWRESPERTVLVRPTDFVYPELAESFNVYLRRCADWQIYRRHLDPACIEKHASLQLWTYKPLGEEGR